jgi:hypothetical protein
MGEEKTWKSYAGWFYSSHCNYSMYVVNKVFEADFLKRVASIHCCNFLVYISYGLDRLCGLSVHSSWLQIQRPGFDSRPYQNFWLVVGLERGLVSTTEELLERKSSGSGLESRQCGRKDLSRWPRVSLYPQKLALTSPMSGVRSVGIVRSRTQAAEFSFSIKKSRFHLSCYVHHDHHPNDFWTFWQIFMKCGVNILLLEATHTSQWPLE